MKLLIVFLFLTLLTMYGCVKDWNICDCNCKKEVLKEKYKWFDYHEDVVMPKITETIINKVTHQISGDSAFTKMMELAEDITPFNK